MSDLAPARRAVLRRLCVDALTCSELAEVLGFTSSVTRTHIKALVAADLVIKAGVGPGNGRTYLPTEQGRAMIDGQSGR